MPVLLGVGVSEIFACDVLGLESGDPLDPPQLTLLRGIQSRADAQMLEAAGITRIAMPIA